MNTYTPGAGDTLIPGATGVTELQTKVGGFIAACGEAAVAAALAVYGLVAPTGAAVTGLTQQAVGAGQTVGKFAGSGQSTPGNLTWLAGQHGLQLQGVSLAAALADLGKLPVVIGVSNGAALGDAGVQGHYVTALGRTAGGSLIVSDPNSAQSVNGGLVTDSLAQLTASNPFWFGVPTNAPNTPASTLSSSTAAIGTPWDAVNGLIANIENGFKQFIVRGSLIAVGLLIVLIGLGALLFDRENVETAGKVAAAAA